MYWQTQIKVNGEWRPNRDYTYRRCAERNCRMVRECNIECRIVRVVKIS